MTRLLPRPRPPRLNRAHLERKTRALWRPGARKKMTGSTRISVRNGCTRVHVGASCSLYLVRASVLQARLCCSPELPGFTIYGVFFMDFGPNEHVFMPVSSVHGGAQCDIDHLQARRWMQRQKAAFFSLSPEELTLVEDLQKPRPYAQSVRPWETLPPNSEPPVSSPRD
jgi:hypothetical protein